MNSAHELNVQRLKSVPCGCNEVQAGMYSSVWNLKFKMVRIQKKNITISQFSSLITNLHPGDPGLSLKEVIKLVLNVLEDRGPTIGVVNGVAIAGGVDHGQRKFHSVLLQLALVCLHLLGGNFILIIFQIAII